jgi:hypothetical protein
MFKKRILLIGMLDSIHVARWIQQFENTDISFVLFPSKKFRRIHPQIRQLLATDSRVDVSLHFRWIPISFFGYIDFILRVLPSKLNMNWRARALSRTINNNDFEYIHALEIQGAGYLVDDCLPQLKNRLPKLIVTNWGSDIYYFRNFPVHESKIKSVLGRADLYSAECHRDYKLARELGFNGIDLPCIPNAGGFEISPEKLSATSSRKQIIVKCYGGKFGRGGLVIKSLFHVLPVFTDYEVCLYSVTEDLTSEVLGLAAAFPGRIRFSSQRIPLTHKTLLCEFARSRVYVGASVSDGISTSFLEALIHGAFPIQTSTSCAEEWVTLGASALIAELNVSDITTKLTTALQDDILVDRSQITNKRIATDNLSFEAIRIAAQEYYSA